MLVIFFFINTATTEIYTLSLHDALPISTWASLAAWSCSEVAAAADSSTSAALCWVDRKSTRLNSSHVSISYAVFCLKKKKHNSQTCQVRWLQHRLSGTVWRRSCRSSSLL